MRETMAKVRRTMRQTTVEPTMFLYSFAFCIQWPMEQAFIYQRVCRDRFNDSFICDNLSNKTFKEEEILVQSDAAHYQSYISFCVNLPPIFMVLLYGVASDTYSRRLVMIIPCIGSIIDSLCFVLMSIWSSIPIYFLLIGKLICGITGFWQTFFMAANAFISCITTKENRMARMSVMNAAWYCSVSLSYFLGGPLLEYTSFTFAFGLALMIHLSGILYTVMFVKELAKVEEQEHADKKVSIFRKALHDIRDGFHQFVKKRPHNNRKHLLVVLPTMISIQAGNNPMYQLIYLFLRRQPLSWSQSLFGYWNCYSNMIRGCGALILCPILKACHVPDTVIFILTLISMLLFQITFACSTTAWMVFLAPALGMISDVMYPGFRTLMSYFVETNETGKIFSLIGSLQSISELLFTWLNSRLYPVSLKFWAGFCFVLASILFSPSLLIACWLHRSMRKDAYEEVTQTLEHKGEANSHQKDCLPVAKETKDIELTDLPSSYLSVV